MLNNLPPLLFATNTRQNQETLYRYVLQHRASLQPNATQLSHLQQLQDIEMATDKLLKALNTQIKLGEIIIKLFKNKN